MDLNDKKEQIAKHSLLKIICRISFYIFSLALIFWIDGIYEIATQVSAISMFAIIATVTELFFEKHFLKGYKYAFYLICILGILFSGMFLVRSANRIKDFDKHTIQYKIIEK